MTRRFLTGIGSSIVRLSLVAILIVAGCGRHDSPPPSGPADATPAPRPSHAASPASERELTALQNRGVGLMGQFDYARATPLLEEVLQADPASADAKINLAIALLNRRQGDDLSRSAALLDEAIQSSPQDLRAPYCRALLLYHEGQPGRARELFANVAAQDSNDAYAVYYVGQCHFAQSDYGAALECFQEAARKDPYLRSAPYGIFQAAQRMGDRQSAEQALAEFQRLAGNPRARLAELKYTRMGPKAEVMALSGREARPAKLPPGALFADQSVLPIVTPADARWKISTRGREANVTAADLDEDGDVDLFAAAALAGNDAGPQNSVLLRDGDRYRLDLAHPLAQVANVRFALWGDYDNDGLTDVYLGRVKADQLWRQSPRGIWKRADALRDSAGSDATDGACFDADHDGDLDYFLVHEKGPHRLLNNNRDGTFRDIASTQGLAGSGRPARQIVIADFDADDDADLMVLRAEGPHEVFFNDRLWSYQPADGFDDFCKAPIVAAVAADADVDGQPEIYALETSGKLAFVKWSPDENQTWRRTHLGDLGAAASPAAIALALDDCDGDGMLDAIVQSDEGIQILSLAGVLRQTLATRAGIGPVTVVTSDGGPLLVACRSDSAPVLWDAGQGRLAFARVEFTGKEDAAGEVRSNASGIGVKAFARVGDQWAAIPQFRASSGPGQSLQPAALGLAGAEKIDFLRLVWPEGVSQSELDLSSGQLHKIVETQRQAGSCPLVFVWDGRRYAFVADVLGAGGIGFNVGRGEYYPPRPEENLLLPAALVQSHGDRLIVKLGEPMEEICYFDAVRLVAYDLPPGWSMVLDERFAAQPPLPTGSPVYFQREVLPCQATNERGKEVTTQLLDADRVAAPLHREDRRFVGLTDPQSLTLEFDESIDRLQRPVLALNGWVEYAYSQSAFAAWQAGAAFVEPTVAAEEADGTWRTIADRIGYPAGTSRSWTIPLEKSLLPAGTRRLRISTTMQVYWDRVAVVDAQPCHAVRRTELLLQRAEVADVGFSTRRMLAQRCATYDYDCRPPLADARHPRGWYTALGDARELIDRRDGALAIIGPGEELHLEFADLAPPTEDYSRRLVLETNGWCKDADLLTKDAGTVEPLPSHGADDHLAERLHREELHRRYNTRYKAGW